MKLLYLPLSLILPVQLVATTSSDVIIIGAGPAGMSAAKTLLERNSSIKITILEATDRIGGRVKTMQLGDSRVEMGAEEHYGSEGGNPVHEALTNAYPNIYEPAFAGADVYAMPASNDPSMASPADTCATINYDAGVSKNCADDLDWEKYIGIWDWYWKPSRFQKNPTQTIDFALSQSRNFFKNVGDYNNTRGWFLYNNAFGAEYATTVEKMGAHDTAVADFDWPLSEDVSFNTNPLGYSDVLSETWWDATISTDNVELKLDCPVTSINAPGTTDPVEVIANGEQYIANQVIVTVSIGVLKASISDSGLDDPGYISFSPELPEDAKQAIADIGFDQGLKAVLKFDRSLSGCGDDEPWWVTAVGGEVGAMITNGMSGGWAWPANYKDGSSDDVLMTFIMGDNARYLSKNLLDDDEIIKQILEDLDAMFDDTPASDCFVANNPANYIIQNWGQSPYTRGAYSFQTSTTVDDDGASDTGNARARLQDPVHNDRIFFAGEGTSLITAATVPGAVFEGQRVGNAVTISNVRPSSTAATSTTSATTGATTTAATSTTTGGLLCESIGSNKTCRGNDNCEWRFGDCVTKGGRRNVMDADEKETSQHIKESKPNLRASVGAKRRSMLPWKEDAVERGGKNKVIDSRGENMRDAAKAGKRA